MLNQWRVQCIYSSIGTIIVIYSFYQRIDSSQVIAVIDDSRFTEILYQAFIYGTFVVGLSAIDKKCRNRDAKYLDFS